MSIYYLFSLRIMKLASAVDGFAEVKKELLSLLIAVGQVLHKII